MAFCNKCGAKLQGDERFCAECGNDVKAIGAAAPAVASNAPAPPVSAPVMAAPRVAPPPPQAYGAPPQFPGQPPIPIVMGAPPVQPKRNSWFWPVVIVAVLGGLYYVGTQHDKKDQSGNAPTEQPGTSGQPGATGQQPGAQAPPGTAQQQPGQGQQAPGQQAPGHQQGPNAELVQLQVFNGRWDAVNGMVQVSNAQWMNHSTVPIQSATLECVQYASTGAAITQIQTTLNGPLQPQGTTTFNPFQMGSISPNLSKVNCGIVGVSPAN